MTCLEQACVRCEVVYCRDDCFTNRQPRLPAQRPHVGAVEEDKRIVADPATFAAGELELGLYSQTLADPADGIDYFAILVGSKVEYRLCCKYGRGSMQPRRWGES